MLEVLIETKSLEDFPGNVRYTKNQEPTFAFSFTRDGDERHHCRDFMADIKLRGQIEFRLFLKVSEPLERDKLIKDATANVFRITTENNHGDQGRLKFLESTGPWNATPEIRRNLEKEAEC